MRAHRHLGFSSFLVTYCCLSRITGFLLVLCHDMAYNAGKGRELGAAMVKLSQDFERELDSTRKSGLTRRIDDRRANALIVRLALNGLLPH